MAILGSWLSERWRAVRIVGALVMVAILVFSGGPTTADVIRILV